VRYYSLTGDACGNSEICFNGDRDIHIGNIAFIRRIPILAEETGREV
jgi:hypothetical protein